MNFKSVVTYIGILLMVQNCMFSVLASFAFGPLTDQIILLSLPQNWFSGLLQISYSIALLITFPLQLFPVFEMIESTAFMRRFVPKKLYLLDSRKYQRVHPPSNTHPSVSSGLDQFVCCGCPIIRPPTLLHWGLLQFQSPIWVPIRCVH